MSVKSLHAVARELNVATDSLLRNSEHLAGDAQGHVARAGTDALAGCANRRRFLESLEREFQRVDRYEVTLSLMGLDLDHFKNIDDTYGHSTGDLVVQNFVAIVQKTLRPSDLLGRSDRALYAAKESGRNTICIGYASINSFKETPFVHLC